MIKKAKLALYFLSAVMLTLLLTSVAGTQLVLADIVGFGLEVPWSTRVTATGHDIIGLAPVMSVLISAAFLVAFGVAALCKRFIGGNRTGWYLTAGFISIPVTLWLIKLTMGVTLFAAARSGLGMLLTALCGVAGAYVFARLTQPRGVVQ